MDVPASVTAFIKDYNDVLILSLAAAIVLLLIGLLAVALRLRRISRLYRRLLRPTAPGAESLEQMICENMESIAQTAARMDRLDGRVEAVEASQRGCLQKVAVTRYDAFDDIGGAQSFTVVMLDRDRNGLALSGVHSRSGVRVYAKEIRDGQPTHPLTREEAQTLEHVRSG